MELLKACRICGGSQLNTVFSLGEIYPSNFISNPGFESRFEKLPLELVQCYDCGLIQLKHTYDLDNMYRQYWYQSGLNPSMKNDLKDIVDSIEKEIYLDDTDIILDIGCNDGTLFNYYNTDAYRVGFDPAYNLAEKAERNCDLFINDYFSSELYFANVDEKAKVVTSIAMFYDLPNPNKFVQEVKRVLDWEGIWVIQFTDLYSMFKINAFDNICHEHLEYYKLYDVNRLLMLNNLRIFDVEYNKVNGGSVRIYVTHWEQDIWKTKESVDKALKEEFLYFNSKEGQWKAFSDRYIDNKIQLTYLLQKLRQNLVFVSGLGASTKGNTLLQAYGIDWHLISVIGEINKDKFGMYTLGSDIPIQNEDWVIDSGKIFVILPWHFRDTFINHPKLQDKFIIFPLPRVEIYHEGRQIRWKEFLEKVLDN